MRVLVVLHDFSLGGTERICLRLAAAWAARGAEVTIFCGSDRGPLSDLAGQDVRIVRAEPEIHRAYGSTLRLGRAAARHLAANPADVCFVPGNFHWPVVPMLRLARVAHEVPIVAQISAALRKPQRDRLPQKSFDLRMRFLLRGARALVALSEPTRIEADRLLPGRATVIPLPALDDDTPPPRPVPGGRPVILGAGRLVPEKGFATLIEAMSYLTEGPAHLMLVGAGPDEARLRARAAEFGLTDRVTFRGYLPDIRPALDDARLFVLPSQFEGYPAVIVEALAAGRPVIATDCTPATALLGDPRVGRVVPIDDARALAAAIGAMLASPPPEPATLARLVAHHRIGVVADMYLALFRRLRERRR